MRLLRRDGLRVSSLFMLHVRIDEADAEDEEDKD